MKKKVLMLSTDQNIFKDGSEVRSRVIEYGNLFEELHIVVFTRRNFQVPNINFQKTSKIQISNNVWAYPTNSKFKLSYFWDAYKIGKKIIVSLRETSRREGNWKLEIRNSRNNTVVSCQDPFETGLVGYWLKKKFKLPLQIQIHTDFLSPYFWKESFKNKIRVLLAKWLLPKADKIRVVSQRIKDSLVSNVNPPPPVGADGGQMSDVAVLPIFVDIEKIKTAPIKTDLHKKYPNYDFIILMASRLTKEKNIELSIRAMKELIQKLSLRSKPHTPNPLLLIVGDGPEKEKLQLLITKYQLQNNVIIENWTNDLSSYYKTADLFLLISNYEGYGRTVVEAAASGLPTIMTDVGLAGEFLKNNFNSLVIPANDKNGLISALNDMIINRERLREFGQNNEKAVSCLMTKEEYLKRYEEIL